MNNVDVANKAVCWSACAAIFHSSKIFPPQNGQHTLSMHNTRCELAFQAEINEYNVVLQTFEET